MENKLNTEINLTIQKTKTQVRSVTTDYSNKLCLLPCITNTKDNPF